MSGWNDHSAFVEASRVRRYIQQKQAAALRRVPHIQLGGRECKSCSACCRILPLEEFGTDNQKWDGLTSQCRGCRQ